MRESACLGELQLNSASWPDTFEEDDFDILWDDGEQRLCRASRRDIGGKRHDVLILLPTADPPSPSYSARLTHEYDLRNELESAWAVRPLELSQEDGRSRLILEDPGGYPLKRLIRGPIEVGRFLRYAIGIASALGKAHRRGLIHKDLKPAHVLVDCYEGGARLTGFGIASRLRQERPRSDLSGTVAGTLAYMAPEQTGRMNRSLDSRSDLYSLGIMLYEMSTGALPFTASEPIELVHCHLAKTAIPPNERLLSIPGPLSAVIMKLLAKTPEDRYQTAAGLEHDLLGCLAKWEAGNRIDDFPLGQVDAPDRLLIPDKLYGRDREVASLLAAFGRTVKGPVPQLVLVSGGAGIGKSSVVNKLQKTLVPPHGMFVSGKFDQQKRDTPYASLIQCVRGLLRPLLGKSDAEISHSRKAFLATLGPNAKLIVDIIPELKLIIGDPAPISELEPRQEQGRFHLAFGRFLSVFAQAGNPLAIFLDDLQWADTATFELIEYLLTVSGLQHLMIIGAYRDAEVTDDHPLMQKLEAIKASRCEVLTLALGPLTQNDIGQLLADTLHWEAERALRLAQLVHDRTKGNPFFTLRFLSSMVEGGSLAFDLEVSRWTLNLDDTNGLYDKGDVIDFLIGRLVQLPDETQKALRMLACLGDGAESKILSIVLATSEDQIHADLRPAVSHEMVERQINAYQFAHDRLREACYSLIPEPLRGEAHLRIGRLLLDHIAPENREDAIFNIVNHFNQGRAFVTAPEERERLARLNLDAGRRARASTAYASAFNYSIVGAELLAENGRVGKNQVAFELDLLRAECEFLTGELVVAEQRLRALVKYVNTTTDLSNTACLRMDVSTTLGGMAEAVGICLEYLRAIGINWPVHPKDEQVRQEYHRIWLQLGERPIDHLLELPLMTEAAALATLDVLTKVGPAAILIDANLFALVTCRAVNLTLEYGNCDGSCVNYVRLGMIAGAYFGDYEAGHSFGAIGYQLVEVRGLRRFLARTYSNFGSQIMPWTKHLQTGRSLVRHALNFAKNSGDLTYAAYCFYFLVTNLLAAGDPLIETQTEAEDGLRFAAKAGFGLVTDILTAQLQLIKSLRGLTNRLGDLDNEEFTEAAAEVHFATNTNLTRAECWYWVRKMQARFFAGDYGSGIAALVKARELLWTSISQFEMAEYHFYGALCRAARFDAITMQCDENDIGPLRVHYEQLKIWAENCPDNFESRAALVGAEIARLEGRDLDAELMYDRALRSARENRFVHISSLAYELASKFYRKRGLQEFADFYLKEAISGYRKWGAEAKVRQLAEAFPHLLAMAIESDGRTTSARTIEEPVERLDLSTVIKVSQVVSSEIIPEQVIKTILRTAIEQSGAERGLLIFGEGPELRIEALATVSGDNVLVELHNQPVDGGSAPQTVLYHALRTLETVILDDAANQGPFSSDPYIIKRRVRSILCLPLVNRTHLVGLLYLENNLSAAVFLPSNTAVLKLLASQAAVTYENAHLYRDLMERESRIRRLFDANIIGLFIWRLREVGGQYEFDEVFVDVNDAFLRLVGYTREEVVSGRIRRHDITPPEWRERSKQAAAELKLTGTFKPYEKEYLRKDGSRVPIMIGGARFEKNNGNEGVSFVLDLTERKKAEAEFGRLQTEMWRNHRISQFGELTASIVHEISQPIGAARNRTAAAIRFLGQVPPDMSEVREAIVHVASDTDRASKILTRIRDQIKKAPQVVESVDVIEVINDVIALAGAELTKNGILLQTRFAKDLPLVKCDRVQVQQVVLNLLLNAIEAMSSNDAPTRELVISSEHNRPGGVIVSVRDSGPGIDPHKLDTLFEPFYTTKTNGMGMGLAICRSIIKAHGGRLWAEINEGRGAAFKFTLPHAIQRKEVDGGSGGE